MTVTGMEVPASTPSGTTREPETVSPRSADIGPTVKDCPLTGVVIRTINHPARIVDRIRR
jgi:hypothetical protein